MTADNPVFSITRLFNAPRDLVWKAWTDPKMLAQWFGPKGCEARLVTHELRAGGVWHSCMKMPGGLEIWGKFIFREVVEPSKLVWVHGFSDAQGGRTRHPMSPDWPLEMLTTVMFTEHGDKTEVVVTLVPIDATDAERQIFAEGIPSMNQGWGGSFEQLDDFLAK